MMVDLECVSSLDSLDYAWKKKSFRKLVKLLGLVSAVLPPIYCAISGIFDLQDLPLMYFISVSTVLATLTMCLAVYRAIHTNLAWKMVIEYGTDYVLYKMLDFPDNQITNAEQTMLFYLKAIEKGRGHQL